MTAGRGRTSSGELPSGVAADLGELARSIQAAPDVLETLRAIAVAATVNIPGARYAGITLVSARNLTTPVATDEIVRSIDRIQYETQQGPCLSAIRDQATVRSDDLSAETRWPLFAARAADLGVLSMLAFQMFVRDTDLGALNLYSPDVAAFDDDAENIGLLLAAHSAVAIAGAQKQQNLRIAVANRDVIGQAKGILMERHKISPTAAFDRLVRASSLTNRKLADIAQDLADTGLETC